MKKFVKIAKFPIGMNLLLGASINCTVVFTVVNNNDSGQNGFLVALGIILMSNMYMPCHSAQNIESSSEEFMSCLLQSDWVDADVNLKKIDLYFDILYVINAYSEFFIKQIKSIELKGQNGKQEMINCIKFHINLKRIMKKYSKFAKFPLAMHVTLEALVLCTASYKFVNNTDASQTGYFIFLGLIAVSQVFPVCYMAQEIQSSSESFLSILFQCQWLNTNTKLKKDFQFFMRNLSTPVIKINLYGMADLNLKLFLKILNTTFSIYALLNSLN
ncbi:hypothetical protein PVAND_009247 [Polypedilum vanderplanki]|uniref:Odorant receptor n=1 Tax=Polypedilum vanderplanki TaxID=319348 RepID=A0A9J6CDH9_POLVA|nr:hypothetical protein PVAND_009247 [Polypedilum vanderplanki]